MGFKEVPLKDLNENVFKIIGDDWMLVTAGNKDKFNTMTASWGGFGVLWNKNVTFSFVRPQRYTFEFLEDNDYYTLSFYGNEYKKELGICGRESGRNINKVEKIGFTPIFNDNAPYFNEAKLVIICKKIYSQFINPNCCIDEEIFDCYQEEDYHKMFFGEIVKVLVKE